LVSSFVAYRGLPSTAGAQSGTAVSNLQADFAIFSPNNGASSATTTGIVNTGNSFWQKIKKINYLIIWVFFKNGFYIHDIQKN